MPARRSMALRRQPAKEGSSGPIEHAVVGLFAGIGGLELGLARHGHLTKLLCEIDAGAKAVLSERFSDVPIHDDIRTLKSLPRETSLLTAGFPCQDLSQAGLTSGIKGAQSGLIEDVFRLLDRHRTPSVLLENVPFMLQLDGGRAMRYVADNFEARGYQWAYRIVDARAFGLPQRRRRVYIFASRVHDPASILLGDEAGAAADERANLAELACGFYWTEGNTGLGWAVDAIPTLKGGSSIGVPSPPAILLTDGRIVTPDIRDAERLQGFPSNWTKPAEGVARRSARWKLIGNAVSVPAASWIGRRLKTPRAAQGLVTETLLKGSSWPSCACNLGEGRMKVEASEWPVRHRYRALEDYLKYSPPLLSTKATSGFLRRAEKADLRFAPGFLDAVRAHLRAVTTAIA
jgi:DNA (cytosine-5)-methyltransferase 1